ncbi:hypothetical protein EJ05DRAFT_137750 [Pseudovirgaria hyperparasitica]|uniref:Uncharacterized protein n=1 Tax=Pseudovirgaria hyperparasitica TaxID=470096 RepID=A0A6A6VYH5_9PEZI|nr:uncharacterized protein EJ05DRAFT_137750 [Pseudovirgaria hyperparasitica]KAF2754909.1 hypothetical protein EJ05DRAFT_137750 [Pseudovirgaria hyperparasitica]
MSPPLVPSQASSRPSGPSCSISTMLWPHSCLFPNLLLPFLPFAAHCALSLAPFLSLSLPVLLMHSSIHLFIYSFIHPSIHPSFHSSLKAYRQAVSDSRTSRACRGISTRHASVLQLLITVLPSSIAICRHQLDKILNTLPLSAYTALSSLLESLREPASLQLHLFFTRLV